MQSIRTILLAGAAVWSYPAVASDALKFGPPPAWVHPQAIPPAKASEAPVALLLNDQQVSLEHGKITTFTEAAMKIQNSQGLAAGNVALVWQPATDTVTVNKLHIIRGDKVIDVLANGETFTVLRRETNLDAATLDGTLTATLQPEGLQEGDIIDLATTTERSDPVLKDHVETAFGAWNALPVQFAHASLRWPNDVHLNVRETPNLPPAQRSSVKGFNLFEISGQNVAPLVPPNGAPLRFRVGRLAEASDFSSWSDLASLMMPLFRDAAKIPSSGPLHDEVEKIRAASADPKHRAELALALVQDRIRYVALLMGQGGYVPAPAETTWSRRFGDCKAKTALLVGILHSLGIEAEPVLVQSKLGDIIADRLPMLSLFDHVLVRAHLAAKDYWLDGTRTGDTDLDSIEVPDFGWGLPLIQQAQLVRMVPAPLDVPNREDVVTVDATAGIFAPAPTTIEEIYRGDSAVALNSLYSSLTSDQQDQVMRKEAKSYFESFDVGSSSIQFDKPNRQLSLTIKGTARLNWKGNWAFVPTSSIGFDPDFDRSAGPLHDVPIAVNHPRFVRDKATIRLPAGFGTQQEPSPAVHETLAGVEYSRSESVDRDVLTVDSSERSVVSEVPYKEAVAASRRLKALNDDDVYLHLTSNYQATAGDLKALAEQVPADASEYIRRGNFYLAHREMLDQAIADFTKAYELDPKNAYALADRAIAYVWKKDLTAANKDLAGAEAIDPSNAVALRTHALLAEQKGDCKAAVADYTKALLSESGNAFALGHRAFCERALGEDDKALADSELALKGDPMWMDLRVLRANILLRQGKKDAVADEADQLIKENPKTAYALVAAGKTYAAIGRRDDAMKAFDRALAIKPEAYIYVNRSEARPGSDVAGRIADLDAALRLEPDNEGAIQDKTGLLYLAGKYKEALATLDGIKSESATDATRLQRAFVLYKMGRIADARKLFDTVRSDAKTAPDLNSLCWSKATEGVFLESALQDCRDALKISPATGAYLDSLGMVLLKLGKLDEALDAYNQAIAKGTGADSLMGRAFVYLRKGEAAHAREDADAARKLAPTIDDIFAGYGLKFAGASESTASKP